MSKKKNHRKQAYYDEPERNNSVNNLFDAEFERIHELMRLKRNRSNCVDSNKDTTDLQENCDVHYKRCGLKWSFK